MTTASADIVGTILGQTWRWTPHTFAEHVSGGAWLPYKHLAYVGNRIAEKVAEGNGRIIVNMPPRHGKSELLSHWTPVWLLDNMPHKRVILCSYESGFATTWGRKVRNEFEGNPRLRASLRHDSKAAQRWNTPEGGGMTTAGVNGPISGLGGDLMILDDPIKNWQDGYSAVARQYRREWFNSTFYTRQEPGATIVVIMTRWHVDDITGWLAEEHADEWEVICFPAYAEKGDLLGREVGAPLCPERYDAAALANIRAGCGQEVWEGLFQQAPQPIGTGRIYANYSPENLAGDLTLRDDLPLQISLDFNINPGMHAVIGQHDPETDAFLAADEIHGPRMSTRAAMDEFIDWLRKHKAFTPVGFRWPELHVFGDASGSSEWSGTGQSDYDIVKARLHNAKIPFRLRVPKANPAIKDRVNAFNEALRDVEGTIHYRVSPRCVRLLEDFRRLKTAEDGLIDKREHTLSHASDAEGYRVQYLRPMRLVIPDRIGGRVGVG